MTTQTATATQKRLTADQYAAITQPVPPPSSLEIFEISRAILADKRLAPIDMFDRFADKLPAHGLFLLEPPQPAAVNEMDWNELMARIQLNGKTGRNYLTTSALRDLDPIVSKPRLLLDVEDGRARLNTKPSVSEANIAAGRFGYRLWTGYIHTVVFSEVLNHHYMDLVRSRCDSDDVPDLYLVEGQPELSACWFDNTYTWWGAPSFGSVVDC